MRVLGVGLRAEGGGFCEEGLRGFELVTWCGIMRGPNSIGVWRKGGGKRKGLTASSSGGKRASWKMSSSSESRVAEAAVVGCLED